MALETYRSKRDFERSPEPHGGTRAGGPDLSFVVHKHASRRLHYDLRLELDGVLLSWACPKGPSFDPKEKRLAVRVEDHPLEYGQFEGVIPAGEYGAGTVEIWDRGTWVPLEEPHAALKAGKLAFELKGSRLHGTWALVHMRGRDSGGRENWLWIKERDREVEGLRPPDASKIPGAVKRRMPKRLDPQLATLSKQTPAGEGWLHEIKFDGYRLLCRVQDGEVHLSSRNNKDWTPRLEVTAAALKRLAAREALLDGELVVLGKDGASSFELLQQALSEGRSSDATYFTFDLLYLDGYDLAGTPLADRKKALRALLDASNLAPAVRFADHVSGHGEEFRREACVLNLEGVVSKRAEGHYHPGRGRDWVKVKCRMRQEFVIGGYTEPAGSRSGFGALLLGTYDDGRLAYAGRVGTGFSERDLAELSAKLTRLERKKSPFASSEAGRATGSRSDFSRRPAGIVHWVKPDLVCEVRFSNWTREGLLRQASFVGLRLDKPASDVVRESRDEPQTPVAVAGVGVTNPHKVLYPDDGITKFDVAGYYASIAEWVMPHVAGRPLAIVRCPDGYQAECFFQKQATSDFPESILRVPVDVKGEPADYIAIGSLSGLVQLAQLGVLEIHTWSSRTDAVERPDRIVIDLDPGPGVTLPDIAAAAYAVRDRLSALGLVSFVKTTGGKGYHVVAPLVRRHTWDEVEAFARALARDIVLASPDLYTATQSKERRAGKVFIDYMRTHRGATAVAAYSTRARPHAPVSVPIEWGELKLGARPDEYTIKSLPRRLASLRRDPWQQYNELSQSITAAKRRELGIA